jgi:tetratricopeptide (TPR) repeat protein
MFFLAPTSGVIVMSYTIKEHWIYYSMIGFSLAFTYYFFKFFNKINKKKLAIILFILIILLLSVRTYNRNLDWSSPQRFFQTELRYNSESENALANLAYEYYLNGDYIRASELYKKGIEVTNSNQLAMMYYNLGYMYFLIDNNYSRAIPLYEKSLEIDPYYIYALQELSNYYYNLNNTKEFNKYYFKLENLIKNTIDY